MPRALRRMTDDQRDAAERYVPLARSIAAKVVRRLGWGETFDGDEVFSEALFGLCKRLSHCPDPAGPLSGYLSQWIALEIKSYLSRRRVRHAAEIIDAEALRRAPVDAEDDPRADQLAELARVLSPRQTEAIEGTLAGLSTRDLAAAMGISQTCVRQHLAAAVATMRAIRPEVA